MGGGGGGIIPHPKTNEHFRPYYEGMTTVAKISFPILKFWGRTKLVCHTPIHDITVKVYFRDYTL